MSLLKPWNRRAAPKGPAHRVTVYTRAGCGCCEKALAVLRQFQSRFAMEIELVDIDGDPALRDAHGDSVPVVAIDGRIRFRGVVNPVLLERILEAESR